MAGVPTSPVDTLQSTGMMVWVAVVVLVWVLGLCGVVDADEGGLLCPQVMAQQALRQE